MKRSKSGVTYGRAHGRVLLENKHNGHFIKDYNFYAGRENTWNNPSRSSSKVFEQYHEGNIKRNNELEEMVNNVRQVEEVRSYTQKKNFVLNKRREARKMYQNRLMERISVQKESRQVLEPTVSQEVCEKVLGMDEQTANKYKLNKSGFRSFFHGLRDNKWNDLTFTSKKTAKLMVPRSIIQKEERAIKSIMKRIETEKNYEAQAEHDKLSRIASIYQYEKSLKSKNQSMSIGGPPSELNTLTNGFHPKGNRTIQGGQDRVPLSANTIDHEKIIRFEDYSVEKSNLNNRTAECIEPCTLMLTSARDHTSVFFHLINREISRQRITLNSMGCF